MNGKHFEANPIGVEYDPDDWVARRRAGAPVAAFLQRDTDAAGVAGARQPAGLVAQQRFDPGHYLGAAAQEQVPPESKPRKRAPAMRGQL